METQIKWKFEGAGNWFSTPKSKLEGAIQKERNRANIGSNIKIHYQNDNIINDQSTGDIIKRDFNGDLNGTISNFTPLQMDSKKSKTRPKTT